MSMVVLEKWRDSGNRSVGWNIGKLVCLFGHVRHAYPDVHRVDRDWKLEMLPQDSK